MICQGQQACQIDAIYALGEEQYIDDTVGDRLGFWEIYNQLCHQGTIYTLTYAAVPHLLPAINGKTFIPPIRALFLLADINISYKSTAFAPPGIPEDLKENFVETLSVAKDIYKISPRVISREMNLSNALWRQLVSTIFRMSS